MLMKSYLIWGFGLLAGFAVIAFSGVRAPRMNFDNVGRSSSGYYGGHGSGGFGGSSGWGWGK